jgi:branched-chain amino acid transport system ATP-binding protein
MATAAERAVAAGTARPDAGGRPRLGWPRPVLPLVVVTGLGAALQMSAWAFTLSLPDIQDAYHLGLSALVLLSAQYLQLGLTFDVPLAVAANRLGRMPVNLAAGAFFAGCTALLWLCGVVPNEVLLYLAAIGVVAGGGALTSTQNGLIADRYPAEARPRAIFAQRAAIALGLTLTPSLVAGLDFFFSWQTPFLVLAAVALGFVVLGLCTGADGRWRRRTTPDRDVPAPEAAAPAPRDEPVSFPETARVVLTTPSLKYLYYALPFLAGTVIGIGSYANLFYVNVMHQDASSRAIIFALTALGALVGLLAGFVVVPRLIAGDPSRAAGAITLGALGCALCTALLALSPDLAWAVVVHVAYAAVSAAVVAGIYSLLSVTLPSRMRTLGFALSTVWLGFGVVVVAPGGLVGSSLAAVIAGTWGFRAALWLFVPLYLVGAALLRTSQRFLSADVDKLRVLEAADEAVRQARSAGDTKLLMVRALDAGYDGVQVLFGIDLAVEDGEMVALLGTNGAGKSTLLRAISGLTVPTAGEVLFDGRAVTTYQASRVVATGIVQVPGGRGIFPGLTVAESLRLAGWRDQKSPERVERATEEMLGRFPALRSRWHTPAGSLSGGEQQMLSLAMAFIAEPRLLLIDELSIGLSPIVIESLLSIVQEINRRGTAVILVEQSVNLALRLADRAIFMEKGRVVFSGPTSELVERTDIVRAVLLGEPGGGAVPAAGHAPAAAAPAPTATASAPDAASAPAAASAPTAASAPMAVGRPDALAVRGLTKRFGGLLAVDGVDLTLVEGEILGLIGPNGAGKTTLFELISGQLRADAGVVTMAGVDISRWPAHRRAAFGLGRSFQAARLWPGLTVHESVALALSGRTRTPGALASLLCLPTVGRAERRLSREADEVLERVGLGAFADQLTTDLSTGTRRLLELAVIMAMGPNVVLLDEPSAGLAQAETAALGPVLLDTKEQLGCSMLLIEHDMGLARSLSDRMAALDAGALVTVGSPEDVLAHPQVVESYLGAPVT